GKPLDIGGWTVTEEDGHTFKFPEGTTIPPMSYVVLYEGKGTNTRHEFYWHSSDPIVSDDQCTGEIIIRGDDSELKSQIEWEDANFGEGCSGD
ncbi:MAG: lamin tail domain-containing protein, partial [Halobacteriaceae archaeon]